MAIVIRISSTNLYRTCLNLPTKVQPVLVDEEHPARDEQHQHGRLRSYLGPAGNDPSHQRRI